MVEEADAPRDLAVLAVPLVGVLERTGDVFDPYRLVDAAGLVVVPVSEYLKDLQAAGRSESTQRSYGMDLLRWFRFLWAIGSDWDRATRVEARDFCRWLQSVDKPVRVHWRTGMSPAPDPVRPGAGTVNGVTGKASPGRDYASATVAHSETVLRAFYGFHLEAGSGPMANPFPLARAGRRPYAHHNPLEPFGGERTGLYRPRLVQRVPGISLTRCSTSSSAVCRRIGTGRWWPCGYRPARGPRSCSGSGAVASMPAASWSR